MGVPVACPDCGHRFYAPTRAEWQKLKCRKCGRVFELEPHERRHSKHRDEETGETVIRYRETPIRDRPQQEASWLSKVVGWLFDNPWAVKLIGWAVLILVFLAICLNYPKAVEWAILIFCLLAAAKAWFELHTAD